MDQACSPGCAGGEARKTAPDGIASTLSQRPLVGLTGEDQMLYPEQKGGVTVRMRSGCSRGHAESPYSTLAAAACRTTWLLSA